MVPGLYILHVRHFFLVRCLWKDGSSWLFWLICLALEALYEKLRLVIVGEFALCALHKLFISPNRTQSVLVVRPWVRESAILWQLWLIFDGMNVGRRIWANQLPYLLTVIDVKKLVQIFNFESSAQFVSEQQLEMGGYQPSGTSCQIGGSKTKIKHLGEVGRVTFCAKKT